ncbi:MAG: hypothetical protein RR253_00225 [Oscillospiraceae bacterium]
MAQKAFLARSDKYYESLGIKKQTEIWEDGLRTDGKEGSYEWWYFDAEYQDGTKAALIFYAKKFFDVKGPPHPLAKLDISKDGKSITSSSVYGKEGTVISADREKCDVKIENCTAQYQDDGSYIVHFENEDKTVVYDGVLKPRLPMWRPGTGHIYFGDEQEYFFAWFVGVPSGDLSATLTLDGKTQTLVGNGYHDHNWGNIMMTKLMNHWYWCRVAVEGYTAITCDIIAEKKYGYTRLPIFMLGKDGVIVEDDERLTEIERSDTIHLPSIDKFMDNHLKFTQKTEKATYTVEYFREYDIDAGSNLKTMGMSNFMMKLAKMLGINPTYARSIGEVRLKIEEDGKTTNLKAQGLWEQMGFGKEKTAIIGEKGISE